MAPSGGRRGRSRRSTSTTRNGARSTPTAPAEDYHQLVDEWATVDTVAARFDLDHTFQPGGESWSVRTLYLHLIEEWARQTGTPT